MSLAQYDAHFRNAPVREPIEFDELPDGKYDALIEMAELTKTKATGKDMVAYTMAITDGEFRGRKHWKYSVIDSEMQVDFLKSDLYTLGLSLDNLSDLPSRIHELVGLDVTFQIVTKSKGEKVYRNTYFRKRPGAVKFTPRVTDADLPENAGKTGKYGLPLAPDGEDIF